MKISATIPSSERIVGYDAGNSGLTSLCFDREVFVEDSFSVDKFIADRKQQVQLETLRDDLGLYLKVLRSAMIDLINKDYADFVNLSTTLVDLDKSIDKLEKPLMKYKEEILEVKFNLDEAIKDMSSKLDKRITVREKKAKLKRLTYVLHCLEKIETLLRINEKQKAHQMELTGQLAERVASQLNQLHFHVTKIKDLPLVDTIKPRLGLIGQILQDSLEQSFLESLDKQDVEALKQCLRIYATIDKTKEIEELYRHKIVAPFMEKTINEEALKWNPRGLQGLYETIKEFIPSKCALLQDAVCITLSGEGLSEYDFLVNAVWPEIVTGLIKRVPLIFSSGNPSVFHQNYSLSLKFLEDIQSYCGCLASVHRFAVHPSFQDFMNRWNLPVYFQLRYQEIGGAFEKSILDYELSFKNDPVEQQFTMIVTQKLWECIWLCWDPEVFLPSLLNRFWKLTLQLVSRYCHLITQRVKIEKAAPQPHSLTHQEVMAIISDTNKLKLELPSRLEELVLPQFKKFGLENIDILLDSIRDTIQSLDNLNPFISSYMISKVEGQCGVHLKMVMDIPRMYRRTNREKPSRALPYVALVLGPLKELHKATLDYGDQSSIIQTISLCVQAVTRNFFNITKEVLTSVQKMEESLRKLKKIHSKSSSADGSKGMSDDEKIRLQLYLDVQSFKQQIEEILPIENVPEINNLVELVKSSGA